MNLVQISNHIYKILMSITVILFISLPLFAIGGGMDGGGGKGVVCRDKTGNIKSAEILDLYEGRVQHKVVPVSSTTPVEDQVKLILGRLSSGRGESFKEHLQRTADFVFSTKVLLPNGDGLNPIDDAHNVILPKDCKLDQLANYTNQNQILIDGEIWDSLDNTNKAALIVHETIYKEFRNYGATDSIRARKSVAYGFAGIQASPIWKGVPSKFYECHTLPSSNGSPFPGSHFKAYNDDQGDLIFQFDYLDGQLLLSKATLSIDKIAVDKMHEVRDTIYWLNLNSLWDQLTGVAVSFKNTTDNGTVRNIRKIGIGNMPTMPESEFYCSPSVK